MFYIQIDGKKVNLGQDFRVDLILENPLFSNDRIPFGYTTSADLPQTPENKEILKNAHRVNLIKSGRKWEFDGAIMGYGARPLFNGIFIIMEIGKKFSWSFQASDDLSKIRSDMNKIDWDTLLSGEGTYAMRTDPSWTPAGGTTDIALIVYRNYWELARNNERLYTAAPIKQAGIGFNTKYNQDDQLVYVNALYGQNAFFNPWSNVSGNIVPLDYSPLTTLVSRYAHSPMYPQLRAYYVLKHLLGLKDENNPYFQEDLYKVVLTSHYHPKFRDDLIQKWSGIILDNDYPTNLSPAETWIIELASYQPALSGAEVIKSLLNIIAGTVFRYHENGEAVHKIKLAKDIIADNEFQDWDRMLGTKLVLSRQKGQPYLYGYSDYNEEDAAIDPEFVVPSIVDLISSPVNEETGEQLYYIQTTRQLILKKLSPKLDPSDPDKFTYEVKHSGLERPQAESGYQITSTLSPMKMAPEVNIDVFHNTLSPSSNLAYLPIYEGDRSVNYKPHLGIYWGNIENKLNSPFLVPHLSYHNYDAAGVRLGDFSLQWAGADGLLFNFHKDFKEWVERDKLAAYGEFIFSPYFLRDIDLAKKILVRNKLWWVKKIVVPMSKKKIEPAQVDLIESQEAEEDLMGGSSTGSTGGSESSPVATGTCYQFSIDTLTFSEGSDDFAVRFQRPGESVITQNYTVFDQTVDGSDIYFHVCSEINVTLWQEGVQVHNIPGVLVSSGGSCTIDSECSI